MPPEPPINSQGATNKTWFVETMTTFVEARVVVVELVVAEVPNKFVTATTLEDNMDRTSNPHILVGMRKKSPETILVLKVVDLVVVLVTSAPPGAPMAGATVVV